jgi:hypothetical protein
MLEAREINEIAPFCPSGGYYYVCPSGSKFFGCCQTHSEDDVCQNGCSAGNLKPLSYNSSYAGRFSDQQCTAGKYYTCAKTSPPFLGCCKSNPCQQSGCPVDDLAAAFLSNNPAEAADFLSSTATSAPSVSVTTATAGMSMPATSSAVAGATQSKPLSTVTIACIAIFPVVAILAAGLFFFLWRSRRRNVKLRNSMTPNSGNKKSPEMLATPFGKSVPSRVPYNIKFNQPPQYQFPAQ